MNQSMSSRPLIIQRKLMTLSRPFSVMTCAVVADIEWKTLFLRIYRALPFESGHGFGGRFIIVKTNLTGRQRF
jgi:hypothetical protein